MAKTKVSEWDSTPGNNTDIDSINIAEGCAPSGINNAIRELMSQVKDFQQGTYSDPFNGPVNGTIGATTPAAGAFTTLTASSTATLNTLASSGATLTGGSINNMAIGGSTAAAGAFTTLAASGAVTLSGGTANGVPYLNGSKVLTTGSALTFDGTNFGVGTSSPAYKLDVRTASGDVEAQIKADGASSSANLRLVGSIAGYNNIRSMTGATEEWKIGSGTAAGTMTFSISGSEQMRLTSTGLGIGTSSPGYKLHVNGYVYSGSGFVLLSQASGGGNIFEASGNTGIDFGTTSNTLSFTTSGSTRMRLDSSGNLGLGVTPSAWSGYKAFQIGAGSSLAGWATDAGTDLSANAYYNSGWKYIATAAAARYQITSTAEHRWHTAPSGTAGNAISFTQAMTLDASGNLLVGRTSGSYLLEIGSGSSDARARINGNTQYGLALQNGANSAFWIGSPGADALAFSTGGGTERARIDSSGNLLVGTTSATGGRQIISFDNAGQSGTRYIHSSTTYNGLAVQFLRADNSTSMGGIYCDGANTTYQTSSDYRLKENIQPMLNGLDKVMRLKPCTYKWKDMEKTGEGFIAHELKEVVPDCVYGEKDAVDAEGKPVYQGIDTSFLVATLTAAIQEQQAIINDLKARLDAANL